MVFQYKFLSEIGQLVAAVCFQIGLFLLVFEEWLWGSLLMVLTLASYFGTQYVEIRFTRLRLVEPEQSEQVQRLLSFVVFIVGVGIFLVFLKFAPVIYAEIMNKLFPGF